MARDEIVWAEKYRPTTIDDCVLPKNLKDTFKSFVDKNHIPNMILAGGPGIGKTTVAKALVSELNADYLKINASKDGNIDTLRNKISDYAASVSLISDSRKFVILDEADHLTMATQTALRAFMEDYSSNCGFILTCNYLNKIIDPLQSRCSVIHFDITRKVFADAAKMIFSILNKEKVEYDPKAVAALLDKFYPDLRKTISQLEFYHLNGGKIDSGVLTSELNSGVDTLIPLLKDKNFNSVRDWVFANDTITFSIIAKELFTKLSKEIPPANVPILVLNINEYDYKNAFVVDKKLNMLAMLTEIMSNCFD